MICLMPQDSQSKWAIRDNIEFAHLYITQAALNWFFVSTFDSDIRDGGLPELLYTQTTSRRWIETLKIVIDSAV